MNEINTFKSVRLQNPLQRQCINREDADLIFEFFIVFSRFEFALKQVGFRNSDRGYLKPDWDKFSQKVQSDFDPNKRADLSQAYQYYLHHPPKIQIEEGDHLGWRRNQKRNGETDFSWVIRSIGIVRNNLFHGGKFPWEPIRDSNLLRYGLIILYDCLDIDKDIYIEFSRIMSYYENNE